MGIVLCLGVVDDNLMLVCHDVHLVKMNPGYAAIRVNVCMFHRN